jgi:hypothetical protein
MENKTCSNCEYWEEYNGACTNGDSEKCADFTTEDYSCEKWEEIKMIIYTTGGLNDN